MNKIIGAGLLICFIVSVWSCGYRLEGGGYLNRDVKLLGVKMAENKSSELGAEAVFTNAMISEIILKTDTKLTEISLAPVVLELTIKSVTFGTVARSNQASVNERRVSAVVDVLMSDKEGRKLWAVNDLSLNETYVVSSKFANEEDNKRIAIAKIAERTAESLVSRLLSDF